MQNRSREFILSDITEYFLIGDKIRFINKSVVIKGQVYDR